MTHPKIEEFEAHIAALPESEWGTHARAALTVFKDIETLLPVPLRVHEQDSELNEDGLYSVDADIGDPEGDGPFMSTVLRLALDSHKGRIPRIILGLDFEGRRTEESASNDEAFSLVFDSGVWTIRFDVDPGVPRSEPFERFRRVADLPEIPERVILEDVARALIRVMLDFFVDELQHARFTA